jgi:hypothetical protein
MSDQQYKYFAFISYNSKDTEWGKRVQRKLEHYRMPATMCTERGWKRTPLRPIFFAPTDIQPGGLSDELKERLEASRNLIVICSPNSAKSEWVGREIEYFHNLGRSENIHFFIVEGVPHSGDPDTECFNPIIEKLGMPEILGANINEQNYRWPWLNKERAYAQLVSKMLGVEFDAIWQRHKRRLIKRAIAWVLGAVAVLAALIWVWMANQPFDARVSLNEASVHNEQLPPLCNAVVTLTLDNESKVDTIQDTSLQALFTNIPHRYLGQQCHVAISAQDFLDVDTTITLDKDVAIDIRRNEAVYGNVSFSLWNPATESVIPNSTVEIAGLKATSDADGRVNMTVPLDAQRKFYLVKASFPLVNDTIYMPCGDYDVLQKKIH